MSYEELEKKYFDLYDQKKELELDAVRQLIHLVESCLYFYLDTREYVDDEMLRELADALDCYARPEFKVAENVIEKHIEEFEYGREVCKHKPANQQFNLLRYAPDGTDYYDVIIMFEKPIYLIKPCLTYSEVKIVYETLAIQHKKVEVFQGTVDHSDIILKVF